MTDSNARGPSNLHEETSKPGGESATVIDAENSLFIVEKWRIDGEVLALLKVYFNNSIDLPDDPYNNL